MGSSHVHFVDHRGARILVFDISNAQPDETIAAITEAKGIIAGESKGSVRLLTEVTGASFNDASSSAMKSFVEHNSPYVKASAVVGVTGLKKIIYMVMVRAAGRNIRTFDTADAAKDWLAGHQAEAQLPR